MMPSKYWGYVFGIILIPIIVGYYGEGVIFAIEMGIILAGILTLWMIGVSSLWFADSIISKILAIFFGGAIAVIFVIVIQFIYEQIIIKRNNTQLSE